MAYIEKPPMLTGENTKDLAALRDFLFRMAGSLEQVNTAAVATERTTRSDGTQVLKEKQASAADVAAIRRSAQELRSLIIKTAEEVTAYTDSKREEYDGVYLAQSDYGTLTDTMRASIETTAAGVVESYDFESRISTAETDIHGLTEFITNIEGEIRRGLIRDPETGEYVTGIAIAQNLQFDGRVEDGNPHRPDDGHVYYYLSERQTFGLYTSTGWQFWIGGYKKGWFSSTDQMLHVANITVEDLLQIGDTWRIGLNGAMLEFTRLNVSSLGNNAGEIVLTEDAL